ncbi:MAG: hypothetical protein BWY89_01657 [Bacteroidetes bacterium ADurb.BinA012]|nr:MAG: hypothetical protein BWY89_01657 [Bacteroidetes bacterium ADurb.BinA012]
MAIRAMVAANCTTVSHPRDELRASVYFLFTASAGVIAILPSAGIVPAATPERMATSAITSNGTMQRVKSSRYSNSPAPKC